MTSTGEAFRPFDADCRGSRPNGANVMPDRIAAASHGKVRGSAVASVDDAGDSPSRRSAAGGASLGRAGGEGSFVESAMWVVAGRETSRDERPPMVAKCCLPTPGGVSITNVPDAECS
jgi:hypothetical protein